MKKRILYIAWGFLYLLCAALGHSVDPSPLRQGIMTGFAALFFVPGFWLLLDSWRSRDTKELRRLIFISLASLGLTLVLLLANLLSVTGSETLGKVLYVLLIWLTSPMICSGYWFGCLFVWAVLLFSAITLKKRL